MVVINIKCYYILLKLTFYLHKFSILKHIKHYIYNRGNYNTVDNIVYIAVFNIIFIGLDVCINYHIKFLKNSTAKSQSSLNFHKIVLVK